MQNSIYEGLDHPREQKGARPDRFVTRYYQTFVENPGS